MRKKRFARKVANDHLELIFGWMPLLDDIASIVEYVNEPVRDFVRANGKHTIVRNTKEPGKGTLPGGGNFVSLTHTTERVGYRCALRATITGQLSNNFRQMGFQPVYSLYDAVPLSFVLGWFSNFNEWIGTFDPLYGVEFTTGSTNRKLSRTVKVEAYGVSLPKEDTDNEYRYTRTNGKVEQYADFEHNERTVLTSEPDREFFLMNKLSMYSILASLSLVVQKKLRVAKPVFHRSPFVLKRRKNIYLPPIKYTKGTNNGPSS